MLREHYDNHGIIKEYKNGNISIKYYHDGIEESKRDSTLTISELLNTIDCTFFGDTYCLNNYEIGHSVYNWYSDKVYVFPWSAIEELENGKTVKLYARELEQEDKETLEHEF